MSFVLQRSAWGTHVRNAWGTKNLPPGPTYFQELISIVPICGFGTFTAASTFNSLSPWDPTQIGGADYTGLVFNDTWPEVYQTMTETLTIAGLTGVRTIQYNQYTDNVLGTGTGIYTYNTTTPAGQTYWGANGFAAPAGVGTTLSADATQFTQHWVDAGSGQACTYTAVLSNPISSASWASWTATANANLNAVPFPGFPGNTGQCLGAMIAPTAAAPGWQYVNNLGSFAADWYYLVMAAANGAACRISAFSGPGNGTGVGLFMPDTPAQNAWVQDTPDPLDTPPSLAYSVDQPGVNLTPVLGNCGAVVCIKSMWYLGGTALTPLSTYASGDQYPAYNHWLGTWGQALFMSQPPVFQPVYVPYQGPISHAKIVQYGPTDAAACTAGTGNPNGYGILGFRPPGQATGGAGGTGPGAGGGAPAL